MNVHRTYIYFLYPINEKYCMYLNLVPIFGIWYSEIHQVLCRKKIIKTNLIHGTAIT